MKDYKSLGDALSDLKDKGYKSDLTTEHFCLYCSDLDLRLDPETFHVDEVHRLEKTANSDDNPTIYAISSPVGVKGVLVD